MGGISVGGGHGGKKSVDSEIPLIPFIDLLLCCVMFLLVTAVWNRLYLQVTQQGYTIASSAGERIDIPKNGDEYDGETLRTRLQERRAAEPNRHDIIVAPEAGVRYAD